MSNYAKTNQLEKDQSIIKNQISTGIKTLSKMQETLKAHREKMKEVEGRVDKQSDDVNEINSTVEQMKIIYDKELAKQRQLLTKQKAEIFKMTMSLFKHDATIDTSIFFVSYFLLKSPLLSWPLKVLAIPTSKLPLLPGKESVRLKVNQRLTKVFALFLLFNAFRKGAIKRGWHNGIGTLEGYVTNGLSLLIPKSKQDSEEKED